MNPTESKSNSSKKEKLTMENLLGISTLLVEITEAKTGRMPVGDDRMPIITGRIAEEGHTLEDKTATWGLVTVDVVEKVLATGYKEGDKRFVYLPEPDINKPVTWVNLL